MFRYQGKVVCPVCDFQEQKPVMEQEIRKIEEQGQHSQIRGKAATGTVLPMPPTADPYAITNIITNKIRNIATSLETETDLGRVREKMECIEQGLKILKLLQEKN